MKISYKDWLLFFGILVAVVITLTTLVYRDQPVKSKANETEVAPRTGLSVPGEIRKTVGKVLLPVFQTAAASASSR
ncbi:MAG: hypothetical protein AB7K37_15235 [Cyclobacteriaceae bacterium]